MTMINAYNRHWKRIPPMPVLLAAYVGYKYEEPKKADENPEELLNFLRGLQGRMGGVG